MTPEFAYQILGLPATMDRLLSSKEAQNSSTDQPRNSAAQKNGIVYTIPSMLESSGSTVALRAGMLLYPSGLKKHRLFPQAIFTIKHTVSWFPDSCTHAFRSIR